MGLEGEDGVLKGTEGTAGEMTVDLTVGFSVFVAWNGLDILGLGMALLVTLEGGFVCCWASC